MEKLSSWIAVFIVWLAIMALIAALIALPVMWLWDAVMPDLFGLKEITFLQALCLALLCSLLFKSTSKEK